MTMTRWQKELAAAAEMAVTMRLEADDWKVTSYTGVADETNADLKATRAGRSVFLQVHACNNLGWISAGEVSPAICAGANLFNKAKIAPHHCDFVVCVTPRAAREKKELREDWRLFVMPVADAERLFRVSIDAVYNKQKSDGSPRHQSGPCMDWVGPGVITTTSQPDHSADYIAFDGAFDLLPKPPDA
jgi:hypothetical protein